MRRIGCYLSVVGGRGSLFEHVPVQVVFVQIVFDLLRVAPVGFQLLLPERQLELLVHIRVLVVGLKG